jgi:Phage integrase, N-terminal SAM-like domain
LAGGNYVETTRLTVSDFLERWIEHMQGQVSPRSHERYAELCRKNIMPLLGGLMLTKLQPAHISQAYAKALTSGRRDGKGGLSARSPASSATGSATAGIEMAIARPEPCRCGETAQGQSQDHADL